MSLLGGWKGAGAHLKVSGMEPGCSLPYKGEGGTEGKFLGREQRGKKITFQDNALRKKEACQEIDQCAFVADGRNSNFFPLYVYVDILSARN